MIRIAAALVFAVMAGPVAAAQCGGRDRILTVLAEKYGETRRGIGIGPNGAVFEVFAGASGSWTITVTMPDGKMCLVASGQGYETVSEVLPPPGIPG